MASYLAVPEHCGLFPNILAVIAVGQVVRATGKSASPAGNATAQTPNPFIPTFIKVGQALSTRPDLICPDYLEELTLLQDKLPPFANEIAIAIIERDLRLNLGDIFAEFSPQPGGRRQSRPSLSSQTPQW